MLPLVAAGVWLLLAVLPAISPRGYRIEKFGPSFARMLVLINGFFHGSSTASWWRRRLERTSA